MLFQQSLPTCSRNEHKFKLTACFYIQACLNPRYFMPFLTAIKSMCWNQLIKTPQPIIPKMQWNAFLSAERWLHNLNFYYIGMSIWTQIAFRSWCFKSAAAPIKLHLELCRFLFPWHINLFMCTYFKMQLLNSCATARRLLSTNRTDASHFPVY